MTLVRLKKRTCPSTKSRGAISFLCSFARSCHCTSLLASPLKCQKQYFQSSGARLSLQSMAPAGGSYIRMYFEGSATQELGLPAMPSGSSCGTSVLLDGLGGPSML